MANKIALIGTGNMGSALLRGLVRSGKAKGGDISVFDIDREKTRYLKSELAITVAKSVEETISRDTQTVILAVKPQIMAAVLDAIAPRVKDKPLVISIAAGISTQFILSHLHANARVIRAMPNAAALVEQSITALCNAGAADNTDLQKAVELFTAFGSAVIVEEKMMNIVTALSASGLGYLFALMEALTDGGVRMGLDRPTARELTIQTFAGAAAIAAQENAPFSELKDRITSPGGTTIAGLQVLERAGVRGILMDVVEAATRRGEELQTRG